VVPEMVAGEMLSKTPSPCTPPGPAECKEKVSRRHHELELISCHHKKSFARWTRIARGFLTPGMGNMASLRQRLGRRRKSLN